MAHNNTPHDPASRMLPEHLQMAPDEIRCNKTVVVEEDQRFPRCLPGPAIAGCGRSPVRFLEKADRCSGHLDPVPGHLQSLRPRSVVHHDGFPLTSRVINLGQATESLEKDCCSLVRWNDDRRVNP